MRSPRTPIYFPESPSTKFVDPFDHAKAVSNALSKPEYGASIPPPPEKPMAWIWICHLCHSRYPLGVTRRCLVDGHYYCSGDTDKPSMRKKKKNKSCSSEFDYVAWKEWGEWRRKALRTMKNPRSLKGCDTCDFPSQCRYPVESHPVHNPSMITVSAEAPEKEQRSASQAVIGQGNNSKSTSNENIDFEHILSSIFSDDRANKSKSKKGSKALTKQAEKDTNIRHNNGSVKKKSVSMD